MRPELAKLHDGQARFGLPCTPQPRLRTGDGGEGGELVPGEGGENWGRGKMSTGLRELHFLGFLYGERIRGDRG